MTFKKNIELEEAIELALDRVSPIEDFELVDLEDSLGRVLFEDFLAPISNPPFDRSPLDGFAIRHEDSLRGKTRLEIVDRVYAGHTTDKALEPGQCVRIMTGAKMPEASDAVIRLEDVEEEGNFISFDKTFKKYDNYVFKGEDVEEGQLLMEKGSKINFSHLGVLASMGQSKIKVYRKARIGILGTGDELLTPGQELEDGRIYDSNSYMLRARIRELGLDVERIESKEDQVDLVAKAIVDNIDDFDLIISTGGVSVGDKDIFHEVMDAIGEKVFWRVNIKPGTPLMFSMVKGKPVLSLSGNPFAALINFELIARPIMAKISSDQSIRTRRLEARMESSFPKGSKRIRRFVRCYYDQGRVYLSPGGHSSGMLGSLMGANAIIDMKLGLAGLEPGDPVEVILI